MWRTGEARHFHLHFSRFQQVATLFPADAQWRFAIGAARSTVVFRVVV
jgi:hypothetical protein